MIVIMMKETTAVRDIAVWTLGYGYGYGSVLRAYYEINDACSFTGKCRPTIQPGCLGLLGWGRLWKEPLAHWVNPAFAQSFLAFSIERGPFFLMYGCTYMHTYMGVVPLDRAHRLSTTGGAVQGCYVLAQVSSEADISGHDYLPRYLDT